MPLRCAPPRSCAQGTGCIGTMTVCTTSGCQSRCLIWQRCCPKVSAALGAWACDCRAGVKHLQLLLAPPKLRGTASAHQFLGACDCTIHYCRLCLLGAPLTPQCAWQTLTKPSTQLSRIRFCGNTCQGGAEQIASCVAGGKAPSLACCQSVVALAATQKPCLGTGLPNTAKGRRPGLLVLWSGMPLLELGRTA